MTDAEILALLAEPESERVERKESYAGDTPEKVRQAICAFANDYPGHGRPGVIVLGQRDKDLSLSGLTVDDRLLTTLGQIPNDTKIVPRPSILVSRHELDGQSVAVIVVEPSVAPPVRYDGRTWIRTGPTRAIATWEQEQRLIERRASAHLPFDAQPLPFVPAEDLDVDYFRSAYLPGAVSPEVLAANHRDLRIQMMGHRMLSPAGVPTVLGVLLLGVDPTRWVPGAFVQFLRFAGTEPTSTIIDQKEITGRVLEVVRRVEEILENHIRTPLRFADVAVAEEAPDYPIGALRQLFRNAVMHRAYDGTHAPIRIHWFSDRIEIDNPGGPFGRVTRENFGKGVTDYRNRHLASAMKDLGLVQGFGQGLHLAALELSRNSNPPLEWELDTSATLVRVRRRP
ncbi:MAG: putative DNA binding domain-containing protein [Kofleriaceae bacterium]|nr:putative DNA binding domain-containing protein [Kofleriaceae bacterium]MBP9168319.1 putative DNA binding domain-containing protein [Kofleriaceae bacterium]MBP9857198.1 putative DNA binding domain-containing protein [Kofleriaceae bacterium]